MYPPHHLGGYELIWEDSVRHLRSEDRLTGIPTRVAFPQVGPWLFLSEMLREDAVAAHGLERTSVAHRGIDSRVFTAADPHDWGWRLLYVGRIDERKGIDLAIEALQ